MQSQKSTPWKWRATARLATFALLAQPLTPAFAATQDNSNNTRTPIKHVIVIIGENRTFDHVFATYKPKHGETVDNLLSRHIINEDGTPGPNYSQSSQFSAVDTDKEIPDQPAGQKAVSQSANPAFGWPNCRLLPKRSRCEAGADRASAGLLQVYDDRRNRAQIRSSGHAYC